jgi:hypothetical protein
MTDYHHLLDVEDARINSGGNDTVQTVGRHKSVQGSPPGVQYLGMVRSVKVRWLGLSN